MNLPENYVVQKLFSYAHSPTFHRQSGQYNAGCPICKEGKNFGKKKRLYFYTKTNSFYCFNCNKSWNALSWIKEASGLSYKEIQNEIANNNYRVDMTRNLFLEKREYHTTTLPIDSINLSDLSQLTFYQNTPEIQAALKMIKDRKLDTAVNKPTSFFISLQDFVHKNRLCIPFYSANKEITFYQTRSLDGSMPKYLNKLNAEKTIYGLDKIESSLDYIFIFEGPIDAMFVKNGVAVTGLNLTQKQEAELNQFPFHKKIWVLDNQNVDEAAKNKTGKLLASKLPVFIWPTNFKCKDFNELAILLNQNSISHKFILNNVK